MKLRLLHAFSQSQHTICSVWGETSQWAAATWRPSLPLILLIILPSLGHVLLCTVKKPANHALSPSPWWTPRWFWSSRLRPSPPPAGTLWCVCRHLWFKHTHSGWIKGGDQVAARRLFICGSTRLVGSVHNTNSRIKWQSRSNLRSYEMFNSLQGVPSEKSAPVNQLWRVNHWMCWSVPLGLRATLHDSS